MALKMGTMNGTQCEEAKSRVTAFEPREMVLTVQGGPLGLV